MCHPVDYSLKFDCQNNALIFEKDVDKDTNLNSWEFRILAVLESTALYPVHLIWNTMSILYSAMDILVQKYKNWQTRHKIEQLEFLNDKKIEELKDEHIEELEERLEDIEGEWHKDYQPIKDEIEAYSTPGQDLKELFKEHFEFSIMTRQISQRMDIHRIHHRSLMLIPVIGTYLSYTSKYNTKNCFEENEQELIERYNGQLKQNNWFKLYQQF